ncbi:MAG: cobalt-precorrin-5B (C(1))-methyltransferase CbiD [Lachnospiraceae bacterium]|nr:cobalt-precorrin-5B (C(1))-methyltransferase CbiD [Lachnospiraceae bacterium]
MRYGFTTGSCATAAAKAAAYMLLTGKKKKKITIETPKGIIYQASIQKIRRAEREVSCAVVKDGGDDPDITTGTLIFAKVTLEEGKEGKIIIDGGQGVGRVTRPGLDQPVGQAAINRVPRRMMEKELLEVCELTDYRGGLKVEIFVPGGEKLAEHTFNPRLGILGGISILGTTGIVEPMSNQAILDTIRVELNQKKAEGFSQVVVSPGNYGLDFMKEAYRYDLDKSVKCSNFIGQTIDMAVELGFTKMLLTGHIGKLIKVAGGIMNTHSREGDCRMELLAAISLKNGVDGKRVCRILDCVTTEEAITILQEAGKQERVMAAAMEKICFYLNKRARGRMQIDCIMYSNEFGELAKSEEAAEWFIL